MGTAWAHDGDQSTTNDRGNSFKANDVPGPSRPRPVMNTASRRQRTKASKPFVSADHKPVEYDGVFRVVIITSGSVASVKLPLIVGELSKDNQIDVQVIGTDNSRHFYTQEQVDEQVRLACKSSVDETPFDQEGVRIWQDSDEWSDWRKLGDPILHIELRRWADLVVVAPCSANFLAKLAAGMCDNLPLSLLRALPSTTPVILCPAMNTHMYSHPFTAEHLLSLQQKLGYLVSGPQGAGMLACGDEGKMTDWRDIVGMIEAFSEVFHLRRNALKQGAMALPPVPAAINPLEDKTSLTATASPSLIVEIRSSTEENKAEQSKPGHTGALGSSSNVSREETLPDSQVGLMQWRDIWPQ